MAARVHVGRRSAGATRLLEAGAALLVVAALLVLGSVRSPSAVAALPAGFQESIVFSGLDHPTALRFASDGRIFVAEKNGRIKVFDNLSDPTPTLFADLSTNVYNFWDRGLFGLALDPSFPTKPYVYVLYTYDHELGSMAPAPRWGTPGVLSDPCPTPPGATADGCVVSGRLSRLEASGNVMTGSEQVLVEDWCQQYPSHSIGGLVFGTDGALYVSGGDGASFNFVDYGQDGSPLNPCGDPPGGPGSTLTPPTAQGGALRSQDLRTSGDPVSLDGAILRVDPATGAGLPDNPLAASSDPNARRIIAYGLRNPFRINLRPGTNEVWIGDVGWNTWEEINRVADPAGTVENFGWPCYEGAGRQSGYDAANLNICESLYGQAGAVVNPFFTYNHASKIVPAETCPTGSSSIAGIAFEFYGGGSYPASFDGALFFADYSRDCIWVMKTGANGLPSPGLIETFVAPAANPVDLQISPSGELFYADFDGGTIRRIQYTSSNQPPVATATATPTSGPAPLTVNFDGSASSDPDPGDTIAYAWDLDGDGQYDDSTLAKPSYTYTQPGSYTTRLRVTDNHGASGVSDPLVVTAGNTPPTPAIATPASTFTWKVGDAIDFSGSAADQQDGALPASGLSWSLILHHCPSNCHTHPIQDFPGIASGSFTAPDHEYPSHLELRLTATDSGGLTGTTSVTLLPQTVELSFGSTPSGLQLVVNGTGAATPFTRTVVAGSNNSISAPSPQSLGGASYAFSSWSDGGAQTHNVVASAATTFGATYGAAPVSAVNVRVTAASDDAEQTTAGNVDLASSDLELVTDGTAVQTVGTRFAGLAIPAGATITDAWIQFVADEAQSGATALTIRAQAADSAPTFTTAASNVSSRPRTAASVAWSPAAWVYAAAGAAQRTPNLAAVVQEVVNRPGWASGNAIAFIVTGSGHRTAESFEGGTSVAALLHVEVAGGGGPPPNQPPSVNAGPDQTIVLPASSVLDGTVTDDGRPNSTPTTAWSKVSGPGTVTFANPAVVDTQATFSAAGTYVLRLTADDGALTASDEVTIVVNPAAGGGGTIEVRVGAGAADAEETAAGSVYLTSSDLELVADGSVVQTVGMRFAGLAVPAGATITDAWIQFTADEAQSVATSLTIRAQAADSAPTFTTAASNVSSRPRTAASVSWSPAAWTAGAAGAAQRTPALAALVQEVVNRPGWASGNAIAIIVTGSGHRTADSYEGGAAVAPLLHLEYR